MAERMRMVGPKGQAIIGTLEVVKGAALGAVYRGAKGNVQIDYEGETEIWWDEQETVARPGPKGVSEVVYVTQDGYEFLASELRPASDFPDEEEQTND
jgi:hypothetical protein